MWCQSQDGQIRFLAEDPDDADEEIGRREKNLTVAELGAFVSGAGL